MAIDLDAARAARREVDKEAPKAVFGGRDFGLPAELPFSVVQGLVEMEQGQANDDQAAVGNAVTDIIRELFGTDYDAFMDLRPSMQDLEALIGGVMLQYGFSDVGESSASES
jgi:hypothetical protein